MSAPGLYRFRSETALGDSGLWHLEWEPVGSPGDRGRIERALSKEVRDELKANGILDPERVIAATELEAWIDQASWR